MVKHVVKPLFLKNLRENILLKKSVFTRLFGVFRNLITMGRCLAPKARALPVATKTLTSPMARQSSSCCHSLLLASSPAGCARKRPQLRYIPKLFNFYLQLSATLPVVTKPLASQGSSIGKSLPRLIARFITRRVRSQTFPTALHTEVAAKFIVLQHTYIL